MEFMLMIVTGVSLALAIGMSVVGWLLLREGRQRSAARVEALQSLALDMDAEVAPVAPPAPVAPIAPVAPVALSAAEDDWDVRFDDQPLPPLDPVIADRPAAPRLSASPRTPARSTVEGRRIPVEAPALAVSDEMFGGAVEERGAPVRRWLVLAAVVTLMAATAGVVYWLDRPATLRAASHTPVVAANRAGAQPLELVSLTQATESDGTFTVTGLVHNPAQGAAAGGVSAVIYLFDAGGNYFASGRAALDVTTLQPGDESPFVIHVPGASRVGRYRVGFRQGDGGVVAHIDRRGQALEGTTEVAESPRPAVSRSKSQPGA